MSPLDYRSITETPGLHVSQEQLARFAHRYIHGAELANGRRVLEVGCGAGAGLPVLGEKASRLAGLDATEALLHMAQAQYGQQFSLTCGDAQQLPYAAATFDLVLCFEVIYYHADYRAFLRESLRVLADRSLLLIVYSNPDWPEFVPGRMSVHYPSVPELAHELEAAGFRRVRFAGILPATSYTLTQRAIQRLRRYVLRANAAPRTGMLAHLLKKFGYGRLAPLPSAATAQSLAPYAAQLAPQPLPAHQADRAHRVLYAYAET
jgi:SAM-dependent methyltransferase